MGPRCVSFWGRVGSRMCLVCLGKLDRRALMAR